MKNAALCCLVFIALAACGENKTRQEQQKSAPKTPAPEAPQIGSFGVDFSAIDATIDPGDDFYRYVNGTWLKTFKIPDGHQSYGALTALAALSKERTATIFESLPANAVAGSAEQKIRDFYASYLDVAAIDEKGLAPLAADFAAIDAMSTTEAIVAALFNPAFAAASPIAAYVGLDAKSPDSAALYLTQSGLGMTDRDFFIEEKFAGRRAEYRNMIASMLRLAGQDDPQGAADRIVALETEIARVQWDPAKRRNRDLTYNPKSIEQLEAFAPSLPWREMLATAGLGGAGNVIVREDDAVRRSADIIAAAPVETLRDYLKFLLVNANAEVLPASFRQTKASFDTKWAEESRSNRAVGAVEAALGEAVGKAYVGHYFSDASKAETLEIADNIRAALDERLNAVAWMDDETRAAAKEKLAKLKLKIGYPDRWRDYRALEIVAGDAYGNARRAREFAWARQVAQLGRPLDRNDWRVTPQSVNVLYDPALNEIVVPAAILDAPLFDPNADPAVNFGAIGALLGHEIGHGLDGRGRRSRTDGVLAEWWTAETESLFDAKQAKLAAQYAAYEPIDGVPVDADEASADLGGLALAHDAYRRSLGGKEAPVVGGLTGDQRFFLAFAQMLRRAVRDEELKAERAGGHLPAQLRVNAAVRNMDAWYAAFDVTSGDALWLDPEERVQIW